MLYDPSCSTPTFSPRHRTFIIHQEIDDKFIKIELTMDRPLSYEANQYQTHHPSMMDRPRLVPCMGPKIGGVLSGAINSISSPEPHYPPTSLQDCPPPSHSSKMPPLITPFLHAGNLPSNLNAQALERSISSLIPREAEQAKRRIHYCSPSVRQRPEHRLPDRQAVYNPQAAIPEHTELLKDREGDVMMKDVVSSCIPCGKKLTSGPPCPPPYYVQTRIPSYGERSDPNYFGIDASIGHAFEVSPNSFYTNLQSYAPHIGHVNRDRQGAISPKQAATVIKDRAQGKHPLAPTPGMHNFLQHEPIQPLDMEKFSTWLESCELAERQGAQSAQTCAVTPSTADIEACSKCITGEQEQKILDNERWTKSSIEELASLVNEELSRDAVDTANNSESRKDLFDYMSFLERARKQLITIMLSRRSDGSAAYRDLANKVSRELWRRAMNEVKGRISETDFYDQSKRSFNHLQKALVHALLPLRERNHPKWQQQFDETDRCHKTFFPETFGDEKKSPSALNSEREIKADSHVLDTMTKVENFDQPAGSATTQSESFRAYGVSTTVAYRQMEAVIKELETRLNADRDKKSIKHDSANEPTEMVKKGEEPLDDVPRPSPELSEREEWMEVDEEDAGEDWEIVES